MILPSIDIAGGRAVQLVGGRHQALDAGDPRPLAERFGRVGEVAVVDLDAALGRGDNRALIRELLDLAPCRVGGGIRDRETALDWLDAGATRVVLGTAAEPELLADLPRERVVAALDAEHGEVVDQGWRRRTGRTVVERMAELAPLVGGFLVTFVEAEGRLGGLPTASLEALRAAAGPARLTVAGGLRDADEVGRLDRLGLDVQVGMALYTGRLSLAQALWSCLTSDRPDGLVPTLVCDEGDRALGLVYSNLESLTAALDEGAGVYWSRRRGLWRKGESSGARQELLRVTADCDRDALRVRVRTAPPGFCHLGTDGCFGDRQGLAGLEQRLDRRARQAPEGSYTRRLLDDAELLAAKLEEEAGELARARGRDEVVHEAADLLYFLGVALRRAEVPLAAVEAALDRRALAVRRRGGERKPSRRAEELRS